MGARVDQVDPAVPKHCVQLALLRLTPAQRTGLVFVALFVVGLVLVHSFLLLHTSEPLSVHGIASALRDPHIASTRMPSVMQSLKSLHLALASRASIHGNCTLIGLTCYVSSLDA